MRPILSKVLSNIINIARHSMRKEKVSADDLRDSTFRDQIVKCNSRLYVKVFRDKNRRSGDRRSGLEVCKCLRRKTCRPIARERRFSDVPFPRLSLSCLSRGRRAGVTEEEPTGAKSQSGPVTPTPISADRPPSRRLQR